MATEGNDTPLTAVERYEVLRGRALPTHDALQRVVDAVPALIGYDFTPAHIVELFGEKQGIGAVVKVTLEDGRTIMIPLAPYPANANILSSGGVEGAIHTVNEYLQGRAK